MTVGCARGSRVYGVVEADEGVLVAGLRDVVTFEGTTLAEVEQAFRASVDDYLTFCATHGEPPDRPYSGTITVVDPNCIVARPRTTRRRASVDRLAIGVGAAAAATRVVRASLSLAPIPAVAGYAPWGSTYGPDRKVNCGDCFYIPPDSPGDRHHGLRPARRRASQRQAPPQPAAPAGLAPLVEQLAPHSGLAVERADVRTHRHPLQRRHPDRTVEPCPRPPSPPRRRLSPIPCLTRGVLFIPATHLIS